MKLVMAIIHDEDAFAITDALNKNGFSVTKLATTGGFLRSGNTTLICGADEERVPELINIIENKGRSRKQLTSANAVPPSNIADAYASFPVEVTVGGATIFVLNVEDFRKV